MTPPNPSTPPTNPPPPPAAARPSCAACKHQRRRCSAHCLLAPYFPADKQKEFHNVHRLYGISNVVKLIKEVAEEDRDDAVQSVIHEANFRAMDPVGGSRAVILDLRRRLHLCYAELQIVAENLASHRARLLQNLNLNAYDVAENPFLKIEETDFEIQEMDKTGIVQQILNDNPTSPHDK